MRLTCSHGCGMKSSSLPAAACFDDIIYFWLAMCDESNAHLMAGGRQWAFPRCEHDYWRVCD